MFEQRGQRCSIWPHWRGAETAWRDHQERRTWHLSIPTWRTTATFSTQGCQLWGNASWFFLLQCHFWRQFSFFELWPARARAQPFVAPSFCEGSIAERKNSKARVSKHAERTAYPHSRLQGQPVFFGVVMLSQRYSEVVERESLHLRLSSLDVHV